ncbi:MAG: hypothetical protein IPP22_08085 [Nitrosomonas sp.]|nr:hypothetical protein [Nitrosomonas sp.]
MKALFCLYPSERIFGMKTANLQSVQGTVNLRLLRDNKVIYADARSIMPTLGNVDYREIILGDEDVVVCTPPQQPPCETQSSTDADTWIVHGRISDANGRGLSILLSASTTRICCLMIV